VHRDLKPENILLNSKHGYNVKLIDFGCSAQMSKDETRMTSTHGTAYYIAPEVILSNYNEKCDLWSVGVILYILLSGIPPFDGNNDKEIIKKVRLGVFDMEIPEFSGVSE
jgi:calcium-dependent protein kinase